MQGTCQLSAVLVLPRQGFCQKSGAVSEHTQCMLGDKAAPSGWLFRTDNTKLFTGAEHFQNQLLLRAWLMTPDLSRL